MDFTKLSGVCDKQLDKGGHWSPCLGVQIWLHYYTETRFPLTVDQNQRALESVLLRNKDRVLFILASWGKVPWRAVMLSPAFTGPSLFRTGDRGPEGLSDSPRGVLPRHPPLGLPCPWGLALPDFFLGRDLPGVKHL